MKEKKNKKKLLIIILCVIGVLLYATPYILLCISLVLDFHDTEYKVEDNKIIIEENYATISDIKGHYLEKDNCYYIEYIIDNKEYDNESINITFDVYDKDGYILGEAYNNIELNKNQKYKTKSSFCDEYANDVSSYKLKRIDSY